MFSLPFELQDLIYDFDGRYKKAMSQCHTLIKQRRQTPIGMRGSDRWSGSMRYDIMMFGEDTMTRLPEYYAELQIRLAKHKSRMVPLERGWGIKGITSELKRVASSYLFQDVLGIYKVGLVYDSIVIDGVTYKSTTKVNSVALQYGPRVANRVLKAYGVEPTVKCIDVLDPNFKKSIKRRKVKVYRELGVSENGIPGKDFFFKKEIIEGKEYFIDIRTQYLRTKRTGKIVGCIFRNNRGGIFDIIWYTEDRLPPK
jgi:hypothetical protein